MGFALGEILARTGAGSRGFEPRIARAFGALTPADIAAALGTVKNKTAVMLVEAKYIYHDADRFDEKLLIWEYRKTNTYRLRRVDTVAKLAHAAVSFFVAAPRCRKCRGTTNEWDAKALRFVTCKRCHGYGRRNASVREIARRAGMSRSKLKKSHINCFWAMWLILTIWEDIAEGQVRKALRR